MTNKTKKQKISIDTKKGRYTCILRWDAKDKAYLVSVPSLPEVFTFGRTLAEAKRMAKDAIELYCECLIDEGKIIIDDQRKAIGQIPSSRVFTVR